MKVQNMTGKNGRAIPNQFIIHSSIGTAFFQSYNSMIAVKTNDNKIELDRDTWDYSRTTSKYRNMFLGLTTKEIKAKIKSGEILLVNLN